MPSKGFECILNNSWQRTKKNLIEETLSKENWQRIREQKGRDGRTDREERRGEERCDERERCAERELLCLSGYVTLLQMRALGLCVRATSHVSSLCKLCVCIEVAEFAMRKMANMPPVLCRACCLA